MVTELKGETGEPVTTGRSVVDVQSQASKIVDVIGEKKTRKTM